MTARPQSPVPGMYYIPNGIPDLGVSPEDFLSVGSDESYVLTRMVSRRVVEAILSSPGVRLVKEDTPAPDEWGKPHTVEPRNMEAGEIDVDANEIDVDALLAEAGTVPEPSADKLLFRIARGDGSTRIESIEEAAFEPWHRYSHWRHNPGHRQLCPKCNRIFIRDRRKGRRCPDCRRRFRRTCAGCGQQFSATQPHDKTV